MLVTSVLKISIVFKVIYLLLIVIFAVAGGGAIS